jgi:hypothetical protein
MHDVTKGKITNDKTHPDSYRDQTKKVEGLGRVPPSGARGLFVSQNAASVALF